MVPNAVQTMIDADHKFNIFNAGGYCDVVVDVVGTFYQYPPSASTMGVRPAGTWRWTTPPRKPSRPGVVHLHLPAGLTPIVDAEGEY